MAEHRLSWNPINQMYECACCELKFGSEFTCPMNDPEKIDIIFRYIEQDTGVAFAIENDRTSAVSS